MTTYSTDYNAIRGFKRSFPHLAATVSDDLIRVDFVNREGDAYVLNLEAVADYEAERLGTLRAVTYFDVPALRRSLKPKGATVRVREFFAKGHFATRKEAVAAAVDAGFAYCTARTQYQVWKGAN